MENTPHHLVINTALGTKGCNSGEKNGIVEMCIFLIIIVNVAQP